METPSIPSQNTSHNASTKEPQLIVYQNPPQSKLSRVFLLFLFFIFFLMLFFPSSLLPSSKGSSGIGETLLMGSGSNKIVNINVSGVLTMSSNDLLSMGPSPVILLRKYLQIAGKDPEVSGVIVSISSPGGGITASDIMFHEVKEFKIKYKKPIIAHLGNVAASGGYYLAMGTDYVMAHPTSVTGSIGVIMQRMDFQELTQKVGVKMEPITSGPKKDIGSSFRSMTVEEEKIMQGIIDEMYQQFVTVIEQGRPKLKRDEILKLADGRIYTSKQALKNGLIDKIGYFEDAVEKVKELASLKEAKVVQYAPQASLLESLAGIKAPEIKVPASYNAYFMYCWDPKFPVRSNQ